MSINLQYNYAQIDPVTFRCLGCFTSSYEIPIPTEYIEVPYPSNDYLDKYYSFDTDLWYEDSAMTIEAIEVNAMYHA